MPEQLLLHSCLFHPSSQQPDFFTARRPERRGLVSEHEHRPIVGFGRIVCGHDDRERNIWQNITQMKVKPCEEVDGHLSPPRVSLGMWAVSRSTSCVRSPFGRVPRALPYVLNAARGTKEQHANQQIQTKKCENKQKVDFVPGAPNGAADEVRDGWKFEVLEDAKDAHVEHTTLKAVKML